MIYLMIKIGELTDISLRVGRIILYIFKNLISIHSNLKGLTTVRRPKKANFLEFFEKPFEYFISVIFYLTIYYDIF